MIKINNEIIIEPRDLMLYDHDSYVADMYKEENANIKQKIIKYLSNKERYIKNWLIYYIVGSFKIMCLKIIWYLIIFRNKIYKSISQWFDFD